MQRELEGSADRVELNSECMYRGEGRAQEKEPSELSSRAEADC